MDREPPQVTLGYIYVSCNDVSAMQRFYVGLLGLEEQSYSDAGGFKWLVCRCRGFELMFFPAETVLPVDQGWHAQPGWDGGAREGVSWSVQVPEELFAGTVERLLSAGAPHFFDQPQWLQDCYWGFPVQDPMGNTVEVYTTPKERPISTQW
jgi:catechol 2,3-dioxygenase-like lactoylglutathione lyase family enzyme